MPIKNVDSIAINLNQTHNVGDIVQTIDPCDDRVAIVERVGRAADGHPICDVQFMGGALDQYFAYQLVPIQRRRAVWRAIEWIAALTGLLAFGALFAIVILLGMAA